MKILRIKPESFKYFHNTKTYYLIGNTIYPFLEKDVLIPEGTVIQIFLTSQVLGNLQLTETRSLVVHVESSSKEVFSGGRIILRYTAQEVHEDHLRESV